MADDGSDIYSLVNQERWAQGLSGLQRNGDLDRVAAAWASQMAASGTLSHNPQTSSQIPGGWSSWGENIAQGQPTGTAMQAAWMNSAGHRANILGDFTDIGIAFLSAGGTTWGVQVFASYSGRAGVAPPQAAAPPVAAPAPQAPAPAPAPAAPQAAPEAEPETAPSPSATPSETPTPTPTVTPAPAPAATLGSRGKVRPTAGARPTQHASTPSPTPTAEASAAAGEDDAPQPVAVAAVASSAGLLGVLAIALLVPAARRILLMLVRTKPRRH